MQFSTVTYEVETPVFSLSQTFYLHIHLLFGSGITKKSGLFRVSEKICVQMTNYKNQFDIRHRTLFSPSFFLFPEYLFPPLLFISIYHSAAQEPSGMARPWLFSVATIYKSPINTLHVRHQLFWKPQTHAYACACTPSHTHNI